MFSRDPMSGQSADDCQMQAIGCATRAGAWQRTTVRHAIRLDALGALCAGAQPPAPFELGGSGAIQATARVWSWHIRHHPVQRPRARRLKSPCQGVVQPELRENNCESSPDHAGVAPEIANA